MDVSKIIIEWSDACIELQDQMSEFSLDFDEFAHHTYPLADTDLLRKMAAGAPSSALSHKDVGERHCDRGADDHLPGR